VSRDHTHYRTVNLFSVFYLEPVVSRGKNNALENFYKNGRQSPVLGDEESRNGLMEKPVRVDREHSRYERAAVRLSVDQVLKTLAKYGLNVDVLMKGKRGKITSPGKLACIWLKSYAI
jgi:hypothetical protein